MRSGTLRNVYLLEIISRPAHHCLLWGPLVSVLVLWTFGVLLEDRARGIVVLGVLVDLHARVFSILVVVVLISVWRSCSPLSASSKVR